MLASEPRLLISKDVDTNEFCYVPVEVMLKVRKTCFKNLYPMLF